MVWYVMYVMYVMYGMYGMYGMCGMYVLYVWHGTVPYGTVWYGMYGIVWSGSGGTGRYDMVWYVCMFKHVSMFFFGHSMPLT